MSMIYRTTSSNGNEVTLFERPHDADFGFCISVNGRITAYIDNIGDAYREYNRCAK